MEFGQEPQYKMFVQPDEPNFVDQARLQWLNTEEEVLAPCLSEQEGATYAGSLWLHLDRPVAIKTCSSFALTETLNGPAMTITISAVELAPSDTYAIGPRSDRCHAGDDGTHNLIGSHAVRGERIEDRHVPELRRVIATQPDFAPAISQTHSRTAVEHEP